MSYDQGSDEIEIGQDNIAKLVADQNEYKKMIIDILKEDKDPIAQKLYQMIYDDVINTETDMLLRTLSATVPYNFLLPLLREQLGLSIVTDKDCVKSLQNIKKYLKSDDDTNTIDGIIDFIINDTELDENIVPEIDLMALLDQIPLELYPEIHNCVDYISETTE